MKIQMKQKIAVFFSGLASRYDENPEYYLGADAEFVSGGKKYSGKLYAEDGKLVYSFLGKRTFDSFSDALDAVSDDMIKYDTASLSYRERGLTTTVFAEDKGVKISKTETKGEFVDTQMLRDKDYIINPQKAQKLMRVLGYLTDDGKIKNDMIRKYNQTERFLELIAPILDDAAAGKKTLSVVDCACGKSYLSFVLNYYLWEVKRVKAHFTGIDISERVIADSRAMAEELDYKNMDFICEDLRSFDGGEPDIVVSLHACDVATDMALGYAIRRGAKKIICVPCCHKELLDKYKKDDLAPIIKHGVMRARLNDILTDGIRMAKLEAEGYSVSCVEYCSPLDTPKNLLIRAEKTGKGSAEARKAYSDLLSTLKVLPAIEVWSSVGDIISE